MTELFKVTVGSRLWGLNTPESDYDYRAVKVTDLGELLLSRGTSNEQKKVDNNDVTTYELHHFVRLLMGGNPTMLEMVYSLKKENERQYHSLGLAYLLDPHTSWKSLQGFLTGMDRKGTPKGFATGYCYMWMYNYFFATVPDEFNKELAQRLRKGEPQALQDYQEYRKRLQEPDKSLPGANKALAKDLLKSLYT